VSGDLPGDTDLEALGRRLNKLCAPDIAVRSLTWTTPDFDARFSALWRHYRYDVWSSAAPNPLIARRAWWIGRPLALWAMRAGADAVIGEHDFSSFCRRPQPRPGGGDGGHAEPSLVRRVMSATWRSLATPGDDSGTLLRFEIRANAFCHQMVRSIVGTLVDVGTGKLSPGAVKAIIDARDRAAAGQVAPPTGLTLWEVGYPTDA
jgi:tRNA pseudouridine38-40 synthase